MMTPNKWKPTLFLFLSIHAKYYKYFVYLGFIYLFIFYFLQFQEMYIEAIKDCESGIKSLHSEKMLSD